jgi:hypothetical protein
MVLVSPVKARPSGRIKISGTIRRASKTNDLLEDLSRNMVEGIVEWNADRKDSSALTAQFTLDKPNLISYLSDYLAPFLKLEYEDGREPIEMQVGLFSVDIPDMRSRPDRHRESLNGRDLTWDIKNTALQDTLNIPNNTPLMTVITDLIEDAGVTYYTLPTSAEVITPARSFYPVFDHLEVANLLLEGGGFLHLHTGLDGRVTTREILDLADRSPVLTITNQDPIGDVEVLKTTTSLANVVVIYKENPKGAPIVGIARNDDPSSPTSTVNGRTILRREAVSTVTSQARAEQIARARLREARSFYQVLRVSLLPGGWMGPFEVIDSEIVTAVGKDLRGRYHCRTWKVGFTPRSASIVTEMNRMVKFSGGNT